MSKVPSNILDTTAALIFMIKDKKGLDWASDSLNWLRDLASEYDNSFVQISDQNGAPWHQPELLEILNGNQRRQCLILSHDISPFAISLTLMVLEHGLDAYLICAELNVDDYPSISRLAHATATVMTIDQLAEESQYVFGPSKT